MVCLGTGRPLGSQGSDEGKRTGVSGQHTHGFQKRMSEKKDTRRWKLESMGPGYRVRLTERNLVFGVERKHCWKAVWLSDVAKSSLILSRSLIQFWGNQ